MSRRYMVRLYKIHDLDLITFIAVHKLDIRKAIYCSLKAFANGEIFVINIPPKRADYSKDIGDIKRVYATAITLNENKDKEAIEIMDKITEGKRNNFLKNILRLYLCNPMSELFLKDEDDVKFFEDKFKIFREGKVLVNAGNEENKKRRKKTELSSENAKSKTTKKTKTKEKTELSSENSDNNNKKETDNDKVSKKRKTVTDMAAEEKTELSSVFEENNDETGYDENENDNDNDDITDLFSSLI